MQTEQEYQKWLRTFYQGSFFVKGWDSIKHEIHSNIGHEQEEIARLIDELGDLIGREWAKDNHIRKIDTDDLKLWGEHLRQVGEQSVEDITEAILSIQKEAYRRLEA